MRRSVEIRARAMSSPAHRAARCRAAPGSCAGRDRRRCEWVWSCERNVSARIAPDASANDSALAQTLRRFAQCLADQFGLPRRKAVVRLQIHQPPAVRREAEPAVQTLLIIRRPPDAAPLRPI